MYTEYTQPQLTFLALHSCADEALNAYALSAEIHRGQIHRGQIQRDNEGLRCYSDWYRGSGDCRSCGKEIPGREEVQGGAFHTEIICF